MKRTLSFGCQAYTWQMSGRFVGRLEHILDSVQAAGFAGFELETCMLGDFYDAPGRFAETLDRRGLQLAALTLALPWAQSAETDAERAEADRAFAYVSRFPGAQLVLAQLPGPDRADLGRRQHDALACLNAIGRRAKSHGIVASFHPNSPPGSVFRTREDYRVMGEGLDAVAVGFAPDAGHIANGGMDPVEVFRTYRPLIRHVHFKDLDRQGTWTAMGAGIIDFPALVRGLRDSGFDGWIMVEEESPQAEAEPDAVTLANGRYVQDCLSPLLAQTGTVTATVKKGKEPHA